MHQHTFHLLQKEEEGEKGKKEKKKKKPVLLWCRCFRQIVVQIGRLAGPRKMLLVIRTAKVNIQDAWLLTCLEQYLLITLISAALEVHILTTDVELWLLHNT